VGYLFQEIIRLKMTFADKAISFLNELEFGGSLPGNVLIMNPFRENPLIMPVIEEFFRKFYDDSSSRYLILGINPGRFGAGSTGIPFTDTKRLAEKCGITIPGMQTHEPSSAFIYEMIDAFGGTEKFYSCFYISAVSPLGFTVTGKNEKQVNYNYYDSKQLAGSISDFIVESLEKQLEFGINRDICFCLGTGKNYSFILEFNKKHGYFRQIIPLEHPRFIMQYRSKRKQEYIEKYVKEFSRVC
jgi:hypothetical protein